MDVLQLTESLSFVDGSLGSEYLLVLSVALLSSHAGRIVLLPYNLKFTRTELFKRDSHLSTASRPVEITYCNRDAGNHRCAPFNPTDFADVNLHARLLPIKHALLKANPQGNRSTTSSTPDPASYNQQRQTRPENMPHSEPSQDL